MPTRVDVSLIDPVIEKYRSWEDALITMLQEIQAVYGYLPEEALVRMSRETGISMSRIYGVATFYTMFRLKLEGRYNITVCESLSCYLNKDESLLKVIRREAKIPPGRTQSKDGLFSLSTVSCLGLCDQSPAMMVNDERYGFITPEKVRQIVSGLRDAVGQTR